MPNAKRPSGPARPAQERRDADIERESLNELAEGPAPEAAPDSATEQDRAQSKRGKASRKRPRDESGRNNA